MSAKFTPTVEQIVKDTLTQISHRYWSQVDESQPLEPYDSNLINDIYLNELVNTKFSLRRIMLLEFSQYLENYLWKNYQPGQASQSHVLSIVIMVNEKFRERVSAWECFKLENSNYFSDFFDNVLRLLLDKPIKSDNDQSTRRSLSYQEQTILLKFLDNCVNSLEIDLVRSQVQKICGLPMWLSLSENRREYEFKKFPKLRKFWKAIEKNDLKLNDPTIKEKLFFERTFFKNLILKFRNILDSFNKTNSEHESGEIIDQNEFRFKMHYLERFLELLIDLEALLPTRRFFNTLLEDTNLLIYCYKSTLYKSSSNPADSTPPPPPSLVKVNTRLFNQLIENLRFYTKFEIDDQTGEAKTESEVLESHYEKLKALQKGVFKYFREDLISFSLTNIATIDKRETLVKHLESLSNERLYALAEYLHLVPNRKIDENSENNETNYLKEYGKDILLEIIIWHMERRASQIDELNAMPLYPTEEVIWNENLVPTDFQQQSTNETCLALPKLGLQFLTLHDYLLRNFNLFRLEAAYELRQDIEDACIRLRPYYSYEEQTVSFGSWSRMAQPIVGFTIIEVAKPNVGEQAPSRVRVDVTVDLECLKDDVRTEWESMRKHDICFLVALKPSNTPEQRYNPNESFLSQMGLVAVRGCELEGILNDEGKLIADEGPNNANKIKFTSRQRTYRILLDTSQYKIDHDKSTSGSIVDDIYASFNVLIRRKPKENNFKAVLESIRDLMNTNFVVPEWLRDLLLGYGDPASANYSKLKQPEPIASLDFNDTFLSYEHLLASFPDCSIELAPQTKSKSNQNQNELVPPFRLIFTDLLKSSNEQMETDDKKKIIVQSYKIPNRGPYPYNQPKTNAIRFTPTQIEAIKSGMQPGLTMVVGPPGTGKTDVAVQIISNIYHNFPEQRTLIVTHSNQALNQLFEKIMALDIDERHLLRLGHGEETLETEKDFSRYGRVNYVLGKRLELLDEVDRLQKSLDDVLCETAAYSCETAIHFFFNFIQTKWETYTNKLNDLIKANKVISAAAAGAGAGAGAGTGEGEVAVTETDKQEPSNNSNLIESVDKLFPFGKFYSNAPQPLFKKRSFDEDFEIAKGCYRYLKKIFKQLEEFRAFELIRNGADRAEYLLVKEAKIIAMTCTHAALKRRDLVKFNFKYDNILMEEAAQILEIETFIPLLLQNPDHNGNNRLKRWIMIGDHNQLPPIIKNMTYQKHSNMEQSLFARFIKLGVPSVDLDAQGRARSSLCDLFRWRYKNLGSLAHVNDQDEFKLANAGLSFDYQLINVDDYNGRGETEPQPYYYQNLAEAEYVVALFTFMRLVGYPGEKISIITTYNGQKHLIRDILRKRCSSNPLIGQPKKITTVDKYQGQQNDFIILSLVRTKNIGHLRDVRRLIVAMSRARLGLYVFARVQLFKSCFELTPVFNILLQRPTKLHLILNELYPSKRKLNETELDNSKVIVDMPEMVQFVFDYYNSKLQYWNKLRKQQQEEKDKIKYKEKLKRLDEEEKLLRERLEETIMKSEEKKKRRLNLDRNDNDIDASSTSSDDSDNDNDDQDNDEEKVKEKEKEQEPKEQDKASTESEEITQNKETAESIAQTEVESIEIDDSANKEENKKVQDESDKEEQHQQQQPNKDKEETVSSEISQEANSQQKQQQDDETMSVSNDQN